VGINAHVGDLADGVWKALVCGAAGLAWQSRPSAAYNYLCQRVNSIVLDMNARHRNRHDLTEGGKL